MPTQNKVKERPILFSGPMVKAILRGTKHQSRRVIRPQPEEFYWAGKSRYLWRPKRGVFVDGWAEKHLAQKMAQHCPYGTPGDKLWVRETWRVGAWSEDTGEVCVDYKADNHACQEWLRVEDEEQFDRLWIQSTDDALASGLEAGEDGTYHWEPGKGPARWRPSIHMPRWASRITLEVTGAGAERVQDISKADVIAEGIPQWTFAVGAWADVPPDPRWKFIELWDSINGKRGYTWETNPFVWVITFRRFTP